MTTATVATTAFDFNAAMKGANVVTRLGHKVRVICETRGKVLAEIQYGPSYTWQTKKFNMNGQLFEGTENYQDLMMVAK